MEDTQQKLQELLKDLVSGYKESTAISVIDIINEMSANDIKDLFLEKSKTEVQHLLTRTTRIAIADRENKIQYSKTIFNIIKKKLEPVLLFSLIVNGSFSSSRIEENKLSDEIFREHTDCLFKADPIRSRSAYSYNILLDDIFFNFNELNIFTNNKKVLNNLNEHDKNIFFNVALKHINLGAARENIYELLFSLENWHLRVCDSYNNNEDVFSFFMKNIENSRTKTERKKLTQIFIKSLTPEIINYCKENHINLFDKMFETGFLSVNRKVLGLLAQTINDSSYLENKHFPLFVKNPIRIRNEFINDSYSFYEDSIGFKKLVGNKKEQLALFNQLTDEDNDSFKNYFVLFTQSGSPSSFVKIIEKIAQNENCIQELKDLSSLLNLVHYRTSPEFDIHEMMKKTQHLTNKKTFERISNSPLLNIMLVNMSDKVIKKEFIARQKIYIEKTEIVNALALGNNQDFNVNKKRI